MVVKSFFTSPALYKYPNISQVFFDDLKHDILAKLSKLEISALVIKNFLAKFLICKLSNI